MRAKWAPHLLLLAAVHLAIAPLPCGLPSAFAASPDLVARGQQLFDDQEYEGSIQTLSAALLRPSNTKAQKIEIYRLLALNYITLNRKDEAESAVRGLLAIDPNYALPPSESPRFRDFFTLVKTKWEGEGRPGYVKEQANQKAVTMKHASPSQADAKKPLDLVVRLEDPDKRVKVVRAYVRNGSKDDFAPVDAQIEAWSVTVHLSGDRVLPSVLEYYFEGLDASNQVVGSLGDASYPYRIAVNSPSKGWILPVAIGGGVLGAAAIVGGLALAGVFKSSSPPATAQPATVRISVNE